MSRPQLARGAILDIIEANRVPRGAFPVVEVAIRGYYLDSQGEPGKNDRSIFDDASFLVFPGSDRSDRVARFNRNTDPNGWKHNRATLCTGIHLMAPGPHPMRGGYKAWRQAEVFTVTRDGRGDRRFQGFFGINNHRAHGWLGSFGKTDSWGCQTIPKAQWAEYQQTTYAEAAKHNERDYADYQLWAIGEGRDPGEKLPILPYILLDEVERRKGNLVVSGRYS